MSRFSNTSGLSSVIYTEWLRLIIHYYSSIKKNEARFERGLPFLIAILCSIFYYHFDKVDPAMDALANLLPTAISVLIGFTVMLITLLLTGNGENIEKLKHTQTGVKISGKEITAYQRLHIQFVHSLVLEIVLLLSIFFYLFLRGLHWLAGSYVFILGMVVYLTLTILLSILRGVTNIYFSFFNPSDHVKSK